MASTRPAHGSFNATKSCKNRLISIGHCCSTVVEGSSRPVFGLRLALRALVSASSDGIVSFPKEKPMVRTPHCWAHITEIGSLGWARGPVCIQNRCQIGSLGGRLGFQNSSNCYASGTSGPLLGSRRFHKHLFMQYLVKTRNHQFYNGKTHISYQPCTPFWTLFRNLSVQNCIANRLRS